MNLHVRPLMMWRVDVATEANVRGEEEWAIVESPKFKDRLALWHRSGETVAEAARMLRLFIDGAKRARRAWDSPETLRAALQAGRRGR